MYDFNVINAILSIAIILGGIAAFRFSFKRTVAEVQERVINALETELNDIRAQLTEVKMENIRLNQTIDAICRALAKSGVYITIQGDIITIENKDGSIHVTRITETEEH